MPVTVREAIRRLEKAGWQMARQRGSHRQFRKPGATKVVTVSGNLNDEIDRGTQADIRRDSGVDDLR